MIKYDGTLERTQFSFKISFLKFFTSSYHCIACETNREPVHRLPLQGSILRAVI